MPGRRVPGHLACYPPGHTSHPRPGPHAGHTPYPPPAPQDTWDPCERPAPSAFVKFAHREGLLSDPSFVDTPEPARRAPSPVMEPPVQGTTDVEGIIEYPDDEEHLSDVDDEDVAMPEVIDLTPDN
ncbi:uncharacterized protein PV06_03741 [Exophiala oligosperma]|uniref:Uncharacterized protein n=1 Tax=Exophiala oligosperma TaxID=215243 RepID=A0A0D2DR18_9EURO|nr:uncharacterized protein PV06_03741 [Exophiala oligosperma]KIW45343.1 hypothetical protein PV06_03741 [Exophiala oligosperma]